MGYNNPSIYYPVMVVSVNTVNIDIFALLNFRASSAFSSLFHLTYNNLCIHSHHICAHLKTCAKYAKICTGQKFLR